MVQAIKQINGRPKNSSAVNDANTLVPFQELKFSVPISFDIIRGFASGTGVIQGDSFITCYSSVNELVKLIQEIINDYRIEFEKYEGFNFEQFDVWPYLLIDYKQIKALWMIHGIVNGCYYGAFEVWGVLADYAGWINSPEIIVNSFVMNMGFIYVNLRDIWLYARRDGRTPIKTAYAFGNHLGQLYYFLFISEYYS